MFCILHEPVKCSPTGSPHEGHLEKISCFKYGHL